MPLKFFNKIFFIALLLCCSQEVMAQYAVWKAGIGFQSENIFSKKWKESINAPNNIRGVESPNLNWGGGWNISTDYLIMDGLSVGVRFGQTFYSKTNETSFQSATSKASFNDFSIYGDFYILKYLRNYFLPHVQESFFVRFSPSYHTSKITTYGTIGSETDTLSMPGINGTSGVGIGLGVGYIQYITDRVSVSGILNTNFNFAKASSEAAMNGLPATDSNVNSSYFLTRLSAEVKVAYTIKQRKPICPITTCSVQQEHAHAVLGGAVVRGNSYKFRQNQKYGDVHRGQVEKTKRKKKKSEREQNRLQRKEKKNRKRLRIIGAGH